MKILATSIMGASEGSEDKLGDAISYLKEDFDYILSGLEHLQRQGANGQNDALMIAENISSQLSNCINEIAAKTGVGGAE